MPPELNGRELLREWRSLMDAVISSAASAAGRRELPRDMLGAMQRQLELLGEVLEGERSRQRELAERLLAPVDAIFDLLEETGATLRGQAEALEAAGRALEHSAALMKRQAELFERTIGALRQPADFAKAASGLQRRSPRRSSGSGSRRAKAASKRAP
jgi:hypothetical protein